MLLYHAKKPSWLQCWYWRSWYNPSLWDVSFLNLGRKTTKSKCETLLQWSTSVQKPLHTCTKFSHQSSHSVNGWLYHLQCVIGQWGTLSDVTMKQEEWRAHSAKERFRRAISWKAIHRPRKDGRRNNAELRCHSNSFSRGTVTTARRSNIKLTSRVINEHNQEDIDYWM